MAKKLTPKQERFCLEYVSQKVKSATQAAINAGYSAKTAYSIAEENLKKPEIKARIAELQAELLERAKLKADDVVNELRALSFWNINDFVDRDNTIVDISQLDRDTNKPVVGIKTKTTTRTVGEITVTEKIVELKFADKRASLVDLGRHLGVFKEDNEQKVMKIKVTRK